MREATPTRALAVLRELMPGASDAAIVEAEDSLAAMFNSRPTLNKMFFSDSEQAVRLAFWQRFINWSPGPCPLCEGRGTV